MTIDIQSNEYTRHAELRFQQRGIRRRTVELLLTHGDRLLHAGDGAESLSLSRAAMRGLIAEGYCAREVADAAKVVAIMGRQGVVTVLRPRRRARNYRRQYFTRSMKARGR